MSELLPCPFCGGKVDIQEGFYDYDGDRYLFYYAYVVCYECNLTMQVNNSIHEHMPYEYALDFVAKPWNSRAERTCKQEERGWGTEGDHARVWLTCGHDCMVPTVQDLPNYCPQCGCKVVGE